MGLLSPQRLVAVGAGPAPSGRMAGSAERGKGGRGETDGHCFVRLWRTGERPSSSATVVGATAWRLPAWPASRSSAGGEIMIDPLQNLLPMPYGTASSASGGL